MTLSEAGPEPATDGDIAATLSVEAGALAEADAAIAIALWETASMADTACVCALSEGISDDA